MDITLILYTAAILILIGMIVVGIKDKREQKKLDKLFEKYKEVK